MKGCPARWSIPAVTILAIIGPIAVRLAAEDAAGEINADQVRQAIKRGVEYLKHSQSQDGTWPDYVNNTGGVTALCTLALLTAGESPDNDQMARAISYVRGLPPEKTYVVALQTMVLCMAEPQKDLLIPVITKMLLSIVC